ncbi:MAG: DUF2059 domain-containing protein [Maritimibacter sp.]
MRGFKQVAGAVALSLTGLWGGFALAAERADYQEFLQVTGFDVAITSMQQDAMAGPGIAGDAPNAFGAQWTALAQKVFDPDEMLSRTVDMMEAILPDDLLNYAVDFYASDLGQRLVEAENSSQGLSTEERQDAGKRILDELAESNPDRIADYQAMMDAIGGVDATLRAVSEVQVRYLMAAAGAGAIELGLSEPELREIIAQQAPELRNYMTEASLVGAAFTYRDMTDEDVAAYRATLEDERMGHVYEILNGIQYEVMAERYEELAAGLTDLSPLQDL